MLQIHSPNNRSSMHVGGVRSSDHTSRFHTRDSHKSSITLPTFTSISVTGSEELEYPVTYHHSSMALSIRTSGGIVLNYCHPVSPAK